MAQKIGSTAGFPAHQQPLVVSLGSYDNRKRKPEETRFPRIVRRNPIVEVAIDYGQVWETMDVMSAPVKAAILYHNVFGIGG